MSVACAPAEPALRPAELAPERPSFVELDVPGHEAAVVSLPRAESGQRPLIVAAHGAGDRAEWHCELWRAIAGDRGFVLCPRGRRMDRRVPPEHAAHYYPDHFALEKEVLAAIAALRERYPDEVDASSALWAGFSQGAIHGALVVALYPELFPRVALIEGGNGSFDEWSPYAARRFRNGGGERVLFACGSPYCVRSARRCATYLDRAGVETHVVHAEGAGHSYGPPMQAALEASFDWLTHGDARWQRD